MVLIAGVAVLFGTTGALFWVIRKTAHPSRIFAHVLAVPWLWFIVNYPIRAIVLAAGDGSGNYSPPLSDVEIIAALAYATFFFFVLCVVTFKVSALGTPVLQYYRGEEIWTCRAFFAITIGVFCFRLLSGRIFGLYESAEDLTADFATNLVLSLDPVKWLALVSAVALWRLKQAREFLVLAATTSILIAAHAILSSSKGPFFQLVLIYLLFCGVLGKLPNRFLLSVGTLFAVAYGGLSYLQRQYSVVRGDFSLDVLVENVANLVDQLGGQGFGSLIELATASIAERLNYLDALVLALRKVGEISDSLYQFGGISELLNIVPRFVWESRPIINFNIYLTDSVWGIPGAVSETPIGRIGESALVLGWAGIVLAPVYGAIFGVIGKIFTGFQSPTRLAVYIALLLNFVWPDSHSVFLWKNVVLVLVVVWMAQHLVRIFAGPLSRRKVWSSARWGGYSGSRSNVSFGIPTQYSSRRLDGNSGTR